VPEKLWQPMAAYFAALHGVTVRRMFFGDRGAASAYIARAQFWRALRLMNKRGKPRYSIPAIALITGHDHTTVLHAFKHNVAERKPKPPKRTKRQREDLTGLEFGNLTVLGEVPPPTGKTGARFWRCSCRCGQECIAPTPALTGGGKTVCGINHRADHRVVSHGKLQRALGQRAA
jgi:hypothetical protein